MPNLSLNAKAWFSLAVLAILMILLLLLAAGTVRYWQAWGFLLVIIGGSSLMTLYLTRHDPELLKRRLRGGPIAEKSISQRIIMVFTSVCFVALLLVPGLDYRFQWSHIPLYLVIAGDIVTAVGLYIVFLVYKENSFASATVEVASDQRVISTGPYAIVRHPMYAGGLLYVISTSLALGSYWGLLAVAAMLPFLLWRLFDEERFLSKNLPGYTEYRARVRWRLIPHVF